MPNMSYCRFRNTLPDLVDCQEALAYGGLEAITSPEEKRAAQQLIECCREVVAQFPEDDDRCDGVVEAP